MSFSGRAQDFLETTLGNDGFFPVINLGDFQRLHRIPSHYGNDAIAHHVDMARGETNAQLQEQKAAWQLAGFITLAAVDTADGGSRVRDYKAAIFYRAKAQLLSDFQTFSRRDIADEQAKESEAMFQRLMSESRKAARRLMGYATSIDVELM